MTDIVRDTVPELGQTGAGTIGVTSGQLAGANDRELFSGVRVKADGANSDAIYVGFTDAVLPATGYKLAPGEEVPMPVEHATDVWVIGGAASQNYSWMAQ